MALNCHAELAKDRPAPSRLTEFYFWISFGGMLGGLFNTLAAPLLFNSIVEYPAGRAAGLPVVPARPIRQSHRGAPRPTWSCRSSLAA